MTSLATQSSAFQPPAAVRGDLYNLLQVAASALHLIERQLDDDRRPLIRVGLAAIGQAAAAAHPGPQAVVPRFAKMIREQAHKQDRAGDRRHVGHWARHRHPVRQRRRAVIITGRRQAELDAAFAAIPGATGYRAERADWKRGLVLEIAAANAVQQRPAARWWQHPVRASCGVRPGDPRRRRVQLTLDIPLAGR